MRTLTSVWCLAVTAAALVGCGKRIEGCEYTGTCPARDTSSSSGGTGGTGSGGTGGSGGSSSASSTTGSSATTNQGGTAGTGGSAGDSTSGGASGASGGSSGASGAAGSPACDGACEGETPVCDEASDTCVECLQPTDCDEGVCDVEARACVECLDSEHCEGPTGLCDTEQQLCVECLDNTHCGDTTASWCDAGSCAPCQSNTDCAHLTGTTVCDMGVGECVQCTGTDYTSCGEEEGVPLVCNTVARTCSSQQQHSAEACEPCVSDAACGVGQLCVLEQFEDTALEYRCFWQRGGGGGAPTLCSNVPPYSETKLDVTSVDGTAGDICGLDISTCAAQQDYSNTDCETSVPDVVDDDLCGEPGLTDGVCRLFEAGPSDNVYACTVSCNGDNDCNQTTCGGSNPTVCQF